MLMAVGQIKYYIQQGQIAFSKEARDVKKDLEVVCLSNRKKTDSSAPGHVQALEGDETFRDEMRELKIRFCFFFVKG